MSLIETDERCRCFDRVDLVPHLRSTVHANMLIVGYAPGCPIGGPHHQHDRVLIYSPIIPP